MPGIQKISELGAPTQSFVGAVRYFTDKQYSQERFELLTRDVIGLDSVSYKTTNTKSARIYFLYSVQETIRAHLSGDGVNPENIWKEVNKRYHNIVKNQPWLIRDYADEGDENSTIPRKIDKKKVTEQLYIEMKGQYNRKEIIAEFMEKAEMTKAGATTYFANMKNKHGYQEPK